MNTILCLSAFLAIGVFAVFLGIDLLISNRRVDLNRSMDGFAPSPPDAQPVPPPSLRAGPTLPISPKGLRERIARDLARAGLQVTSTEYLLANLLTILLGLLVGFALFRGNPILILLCAIPGIVAPKLYLRYLQGKRLEEFVAKLGSTLSLIANALRSGYGLSAAFETVSKEAAPPISTEFGRVIREVALGLSMQDALANLLRRNPSIDLELVIMAININRQVGGNLAETLDQISTTIRERTRLVSEVSALTAQQRFTAGILTFLPPLLAGVLFIINRDYVAVLWETNCGLAMLGIGATLMVLGYFGIRRILAIHY